VANPPALENFWDLLLNYPFLGMFQMKLCQKNFETRSLMYVSVLESSILAIIFPKY